MGYCLERIGLVALRLLHRLLAGHLRSWQEAWSSAWHEPYLERRLLGLCMGMVITYVLIPVAFDDLGLMSGISYLMSVYLAFSNATFFRLARVGRTRNVPLGLVAPIFILVGVVGSSAIRPLLGDARNAALAHDFVGAVTILGVFGVMMLWFRSLQRGTPY